MSKSKRKTAHRHQRVSVVIEPERGQAVQSAQHSMLPSVALRHPIAVGNAVNATPAPPASEAPQCRECGKLMRPVPGERWRLHPAQQAALIVSRRWTSIGSEYHTQFGDAKPLVWWCDHRAPKR